MSENIVVAERLDIIKDLINVIFQVASRHKSNRSFKETKRSYNDFVKVFKTLDDEEKLSLSQQVRKKNFQSQLYIDDVYLNISAFFAFCTSEESLSLKSLYCKLLNLNEPSLMTVTETSYLEGNEPKVVNYSTQLLQNLPKMLDDLINPGTSEGTDIKDRILSSVDSLFGIPALTNITNSFVEKFSSGKTPSDGLRNIIDVMAQSQPQIEAVGREISNKLYGDEKRDT
jgi:hypothetical protein